MSHPRIVMIRRPQSSSPDEPRHTCSILQLLKAERAKYAEDLVNIISAVSRINRIYTGHEETYTKALRTFSGDSPLFKQVFTEAWSNPNPSLNVMVLLSYLHEDLGRDGYLNFRDEFNSSGEDSDNNLAFHHEQLGHIRLFCKRMRNNIHVVNIKHCHFYVWNIVTLLWERYDDIAVLADIILSHLFDYLTEVATAKDHDEMEDIFKKVQTITYCRSLAYSVKVRLYDPLFLDKLNSKDDLLPVLGGLVVNLRDGSIGQRIKEDYFSMQCPVNYRPSVTSDRIKEFIQAIALDDLELIDWLQYIFGYFLTGCNHFEKFFIFYGELGANGKTTLSNLLQCILGDYYVQADKSIVTKLEEAKAGSASPFLAELRGRRVAVSSELKVEDKLNEAQIKAITGGDPVKARELYGSPMEFKPKCKLVTLTNHKPECSVDPALWRRMCLVPFECQFVDNPKDSYQRKLNDTFKSIITKDHDDHSAFLNWCVGGAIRVFKEKFYLPKVVEEATKEYYAEQDILKQFVDAWCIYAPVGKERSKEYRVQASVLHERYCAWCERYDRKPLGVRLFGKGMRMLLPCEKDGYNFYLGIQLKTSDTIASRLLAPTIPKVST